MFARFDLSALSRRRSAKLVLAFLAPVVAIALLTLTARAWRDKKGSPTKQDAVAARPSPPPLNAGGYVRRAFIRSRLRDALSALGDRLEKPGKERLTLVGTLRRQNYSQATPFRLFMELPHRMRLEEQGARPRVIGFDGNNGWASDAALSDADRDTIEALVFDSADHFFLGQMQGFATRELGSRFRLDDGATANYTGPFYDIYQVADHVKIGDMDRDQFKLFYFNSDTKLLERLCYQISDESKNTDVEIHLGWLRKGDGQPLPVSIERLENKQSVLTLAIASAIAGPRLADRIFNAP